MGNGFDLDAEVEGLRAQVSKIKTVSLSVLVQSVVQGTCFCTHIS